MGPPHDPAQAREVHVAGEDWVVVRREEGRALGQALELVDEVVGVFEEDELSAGLAAGPSLSSDEVQDLGPSVAAGTESAVRLVDEVYDLVPQPVIAASPALIHALLDDAPRRSGACLL